MSDSGMPDWALDGGRLSPERIKRGLYLYGYAVDDPEGGTTIKPELATDYPKLFELLFAYNAAQIAEQYTDMIEKGKVVGYYDSEGNHKYRIED